MKRIAAVIALAAAGTVLVAAPANADPSVCGSYDVSVSINGQGQGQAGSQCLPG